MGGWDSRSQEKNGPFFSISSWIFIFWYVLDCQDFEEKILVLLSKFEILKKILFHFSKEWDFANRFSFSSRFFTQCLFQFSWEIIFCSLGWFWPSVFCRKGKYFKKTVLWGGWRRRCQGVWHGWRRRSRGWILLATGVHILKNDISHISACKTNKW